MSNLSLNIGLKGMRAAQSALEAIGQNLANANTPGYSRQRPDIQASRSLRVGRVNFGTGADVTGMSRAHDDVLSRRIVAQVGIAGRFASSLQAMNGVEAVLREPGESGLGALMDRFFESVAELSTGTEDLVRRGAVSQAAQDLVAQFHQVAGDTAQLRAEIEGQVAALTGEVNALARQIRDLNAEVSKAEAGGGTANDLRDRREVALEELGALVDVKYKEDSHGAITVTIGGRLLASTALVHELRSEVDAAGELRVYADGAAQPLHVVGGALGGLLHVREGFLPGLQERFDRLARNLALEVNRVHSTGSPPGGFARLSGTVALADQDGDGDVLDETLASAGTQFAIQAGELNVHVVDQVSGALETSVIAIDPTSMSVGELLATLSAVDGLNASLDSLGRVQVFADPGKRFDFSTRLNEAPDQHGALGGGQASLATPGAGPFALADGMTLDLTGPASSFTVTLDAADFANVSAATADELAAALNQDAGFVANGLRAVTMGEHLVLQTLGTGSAASFDLTGGTALGALGLAPATVTGHATAVDVQLRGAYTGSANKDLVFRPLSDGRIGATPGLQVEVRDGDGVLVATLDVGDGYLPGTELALPDGLSVSFTVGELSATDNDVLVQRVLADGDTADVLVGLGLNGFFTGTDAMTLAVEERIVRDPGLIATSQSGAPGDNGVLLALQALQTQAVAGLDTSLSAFYGATVSDVGFQVASTEAAAETEALLVDSLRARKQEVSGVNIDEELVDMIRFEQAFGATAQYIQVVNQLAETVLSLI
jgi:flagellar hook-associated protein 1 FlgK